MKICFLDNTDFKYNRHDKYSHKLRGAETILINLAEQFTKKGHQVTIYNNCHDFNNDNLISWININSFKENDIKKKSYDLAISNADARFFDYIDSKKKIVISYSLQSIEKFIRKKQLIAYLKHKPTYFLIGKYHQNNRSKLISLFGSKIFNLAVDDNFINTKLNANIDHNLSIFTSRNDRNLDLLVDIWNNNIFPFFNSGKLMITPLNNYTNINTNISFRSMANQNLLINDLLKARIFLVPGHKAELFCLAAEEARELCIPIITLGIGSLKERVIHEKTGFIAKDNKEFGQYTLALYKDNNLWSNIRNNLISLRGSSNWSKVSDKFLKLVDVS